MNAMVTVIKKYFHRIINTLFPLVCSCCNQYSASPLAICEPCQWHLPWTEEDTCRRCGLPTQSIDDWQTCSKCRPNPPAFDRVCALFYYRPPIKKMLTQLKFSRGLGVAEGLGSLFASRLAKWGYTPENCPQVIIPMPLHRKRLRQRGYNQAYELSKGLLRYKSGHQTHSLFIPINNRLCSRVKSTAPQSGLNKAKRKKNIVGAFSIAPEIIAFSHVAIFDDVVTTGETAHALSLALKQAGVERVDVWCICRA